VARVTIKQRGDIGDRDSLIGLRPMPVHPHVVGDPLELQAHTLAFSGYRELKMVSSH
jgi:hypothetical protein